MSETKVGLAQEVRTALEERIQSGKLDLPLLPGVASQVLAEGFDSDSDIRRLSDLIHRDQAIAGHVLRVANSAAYSPGSPIVSLQQAVMRLGFSQLREIVVAVAMKSRVFQAPGYESEVARLWQHSAGAAAFAKEIARMRRRNVEGAFLCGLLHDVGKPILLLALVDLQKELKQPADRDAVIAAATELHTRVGSLLAERWSLPAQVAESIAFHHNHEAAPTSREAAALTLLANRLSHHVVPPSDLDELQTRDHPVFAELNLYPDEVDALLAKREEVLKFVEALK